MILDEIDNYKMTRKLIEKYALILILASIATFFLNSFGSGLIEEVIHSIGLDGYYSYYLIPTLINFLIAYLIYSDMEHYGLTNWYIILSVLFSKFMGISFFLILVAVYDKNTEYGE